MTSLEILHVPKLEPRGLAEEDIVGTDSPKQESKVDETLRAADSSND